MSSEPLTTTETNLPVKKEVKVLKTLCEKATGVVKWYNLRNLYGFIFCDGENKDIFVHKSAIVNYQKFPSLRIKEPVEFKIVQTTNGIEAAEVTGPGGAKVKGFRYMNSPRRYGGNQAGNGEARNGEEDGQQPNKANLKPRSKNDSTSKTGKKFESGDENGAEGKKRPTRGRKPNGQTNGAPRYNGTPNGDESNGAMRGARNGRGGRPGRGGRGGRGPMRGGRGRGGAVNTEQA